MTINSNRHGSATVTLPSATEILITRRFDVPAPLLFTAVTTPELVKRWWGFESTRVARVRHRPSGGREVALPQPRWRHGGRLSRVSSRWASPMIRMPQRP